MIGGLYYVAPVFVTDEKGEVQSSNSDLQRVANGDLSPYLPEVTIENPVLFLEYGQPITDELRDRGKEVDLPVIRSLLRANELGNNIDPLAIQWFHGSYHAKPFQPILPPEIEPRFVCLKRSPQSMAFSLFNVWNKRWSKFESGKSDKKSFCEFYTAKFLNEMIDMFSGYVDLESFGKTAILNYEDLLNNEKPLESLVSNCIEREPKLSPRFVWKNASFQTIARKGSNNTFYRAGERDGWVEKLTERELHNMQKIEEQVDFELMGYPTTKEILGMRKSKSTIDFRKWFSK